MQYNMRKEIDNKNNYLYVLLFLNLQTILQKKNTTHLIHAPIPMFLLSVVSTKYFHACETMKFNVT